ncbi:hypothetical protein J2129_000751 [Methanofollis sp. W23]|nr:hypothetical protein [Methanofollis sp. W23]
MKPTILWDIILTRASPLEEEIVAMIREEERSCQANESSI